MPHHPTDDLARAREALTIFRVWEVAASEGAIMPSCPPPTRDGLIKSPFRDDGRNGSFSVCHGGRGFKDFGGDGSSGDVWRFAKLCWPNLTDGELAKKYIEMSGIIRTPRPQPTAPGAAAPAAVDPRLEKAAKAMAKRDHLRHLEDAVYEELERQLGPKTEVKAIPGWPDFVRERYLEGWRVLRNATARMSSLAKDRGWPVEWVCELVGMGLLSYPLERWVDLEGTARRQKAFRVDLPAITIVASPDGKGSIAKAELCPIGYHQRWFMAAKGEALAQKGWLYVPSVPKAILSTFDRALTEYGAGLGVTPDKRAGLFPPLPFVLGDLTGTKVIVLLEGQWDAVSFFGACGYFEDSNPPAGVAVFGIRGAQGLDVFLAYWAKWIRHNQPLAWIIADNDKAGQTWLRAPEAKPGLPRSPTFAERLEYVGCRKVLTSWLNPGAWGKDFNDYYKAAKPGPAKMADWMRRIGVMKEDGKWA
jgi:hypothetical protein